MASESIVGNDGVREKQRYSEHKVYTRKSFKGLKKNLSAVSNTVAAAATTTTTSTPVVDDSSATNANLAATTTLAVDNCSITIADNEKPAAVNAQVTPTDTATVTTATGTTVDIRGEKDGAEHVVEEHDGAQKDGNDDGKGIDNGEENHHVNIEENSVEVPQVEIVDLEEDNLPQEQPILRANVTSNDSSDVSRQHVERVTSAVEATVGNGVVKEGLESTVQINLASKSKQEMRELRRKLETELDVVRNLVKRIEVKERQIGIGSRSSNSLLFNNGLQRAHSNVASLQRVHSDVASVRIPREIATPVPTPTPRQSRPLNQLSISVLENSQGAVENLEKEKRTPKANQFYRNSEFLLAKDKFPPAESNKKSKLNGKKQSGNQLGLAFGTGTKVFKNCSALLEKLMKHKHGWVFNAPVDVKTLGLTDYYAIIKHPMDLGTVKSRLNKNWYKSPEEFAEDVRLTFDNAMTYNPKGQDVHVMAEVLLNIFEERWSTIKSDYDREMRFAVSYEVGVPTPTSRKAPVISLPPPLDMRRILDRSDSMAYTPAMRPISTTPSSRTPAPKKPKAKDPHKRDMTYEEKQKLSTNLQNLPSDKLDNIVQIIKKRNSALNQHDDEIEVDIDSVDAETLWELDRFVTNYKKSLSKNKRKAELAIQARAAAEQNAQEKTPVPVVANVQAENQRDERNVTTSPPVQLEKQGDNGSRSSSSSSSSSDSGSSSSDSDSDSSSASGSDIGQ